MSFVGGVIGSYVDMCEMARSQAYDAFSMLAKWERMRFSQSLTTHPKLGFGNYRSSGATELRR